MPDTLTVNDAEFSEIRLLGKGEGGYCYLAKWDFEYWGIQYWTVSALFP